MPGRARSGGSSREFHAFLRRDWGRWLADLPEVATGVGERAYDDRWTDDSAAGIEARRRHLEETWEELRHFSARSLDPADRLNFELYREQVGTAREGLRWGQDPVPFRLGFPRNLRMPMSQVDGVHLSAPDTLLMQPRASVEDYRVLLRRFGRLPAALDEQIPLLESGLRTGWTPPRITLRDLPRQVAELMPADPTKSAAFQALVDFPASVPEAERPALVEEGRRIYERELVPALGRLHRFLEETYVPACRTEIGASSLPDGEAWYRYLVAWETTTRLSPREVHEIGQREVARLRTEMDRVRTEAGFAGSLEEFKTMLRHDPKFVHPSTEALLAGYRSLAKTIDPQLANQFGKLPRLPYGILPVPDYRAAASPAAYYYSGATATGRAGYFFVNTYDLPARPTWEMEALTLHEAVPGHHLQLALMEELEKLPDFRRFTGYTAFVEGWGLYAEGLGRDLGLYRDPYARFGQLSMDAWRSARLVVDTGMHALGWSREKAIDFLREASGKSDTDIIAEVDRYIVWPAQALAYKVGQLKLAQARERARARLGDRFDIRAFHDFVLSEGGLPLDQLEARLDAWLRAQAPVRAPRAKHRATGNVARRAERGRTTRRPPRTRTARRARRSR